MPSSVMVGWGEGLGICCRAKGGVQVWGGMGWDEMNGLEFRETG